MVWCHLQSAHCCLSFSPPSFARCTQATCRAAGGGEEEHTGNSTASTVSTRAAVQTMWLTLIRLLSFLVRDVHFALLFCEAAPLDVAAILSTLLARVAHPAAASNPDALEIALQTFALLSHSALPWPFLQSFLAEALSAAEKLMLRQLAARAVPAGPDLSSIAATARHTLAFLGAVWRHGMPFFFRSSGAGSTAAAGGAACTLTDDAQQLRIAQQYQRCVGMLLRIDWTMLQREERRYRESFLSGSSNSASQPPPTVELVSGTAALLHQHALRRVE